MANDDSSREEELQAENERLRREIEQLRQQQADSQPTVDTGGGANIGQDAHAERDLIGRDQIVEGDRMEGRDIYAMYSVSFSMASAIAVRFAISYFLRDS